MMDQPRRARKQSSLLLAFALSMVLGACAYRMDIQQGNRLDEETVAQVQEGMTRKQVRFLLGTPMIEDPFHAERWDYVYFLKPGRQRTTQEHHLIVYFTGDVVARIDRVTGY
jgi:outer membrane protein assembly factor BamE